jgi:FkbM family methyltransferase
MKKIIRGFFGLLGYEIRKQQKGGAEKPRQASVQSIRTERLTYHETLTGNYYLPTDAKNDNVANTIIAGQIFEKEVVDLARQFIKENTVVLDVGANYGQMSILFSETAGPGGMVYAFDADDFVFEILKKNIAANNRQDQIKPLFGAVHNADNETLYFPVQDFVEFGAYGSYGIDYRTTAGRPVKSLTIDSLGINRPVSFMKIDIQGGDLMAMQGAIKTISKYRMPILFEYEYHFEERFNLCFQDYVDFVRSINYKFSRVINGHNYLIMPCS